MCGAGDPIPMPVSLGFSLRRGRGGSFAYVLVMQTHRGSLAFQVLIHSDCAVSLSLKLVTGHRNCIHTTAWSRRKCALAKMTEIFSALYFVFISLTSVLT